MLVNVLVGWRLRDYGVYLVVEGLLYLVMYLFVFVCNCMLFEVFRLLNDVVLLLIVEGEKLFFVLFFVVFVLLWLSVGYLCVVVFVKLFDVLYDIVGIVLEKCNGIGWKVMGWVLLVDY